MLDMRHKHKRLIGRQSAVEGHIMSVNEEHRLYHRRLVPVNLERRRDDEAFDRIMRAFDRYGDYLIACYVGAAFSLLASHALLITGAADSLRQRSHDIAQKT